MKHIFDPSLFTHIYVTEHYTELALSHDIVSSSLFGIKVVRGRIGKNDRKLK